MENAKKINPQVEAAVIVANFMKGKMEQRIKNELASVGKGELWKEIERYAELTTAYSLYELITK